jgi:hypothetical protein
MLTGDSSDPIIVSIILNLRRAPPPTASGLGLTKETIDRLLDERRQARIGLALVGGSAVTALCIIGWIIVALL